MPGSNPTKFREYQSNACRHFVESTFFYSIQGDQLCMAVLFWYLAKYYLSSVCYNTVVYTSVFNYKVPEQDVHVYLVEL